MLRFIGTIEVFQRQIMSGLKRLKHATEKGFDSLADLWVEARLSNTKHIEWSFPKELVCSSPLQELPGYIIYYMEESAEQLHY